MPFGACSCSPVVDSIKGSDDNGNALEVHGDCCWSAARPILQIALPDSFDQTLMLVQMPLKLT
jgi:hypothetical protein